MSHGSILAQKSPLTRRESPLGPFQTSSVRGYHFICRQCMDLSKHREPERTEKIKGKRSTLFLSSLFGIALPNTQSVYGALCHKISQSAKHTARLLGFMQQGLPVFDLLCHSSLFLYISHSFVLSIPLPRMALSEVDSAPQSAPRRSLEATDLFVEEALIKTGCVCVSASLFFSAGVCFYAAVRNCVW